jgi:hypothetical protein
MPTESLNLVLGIDTKPPKSPWFDVSLADLFERLRVATPPSGSVRFGQGNEACHGYPINCCSIAMPLTEQGAYMTTGDLECGWQGSGLSIEYLAAR